MRSYGEKCAGKSLWQPKTVFYTLNVTGQLSGPATLAELAGAVSLILLILVVSSDVGEFRLVSSDGRVQMGEFRPNIANRA